MIEPVLELTDISKDYHGLRPLRISRLSIAAGEQVALLGFDQVAAEVFVNLVTGATLPDRGAVRLFGRTTADITGPDEWLKIVDRVGIVSKRAVLLAGLTVIQNLALPYTLEIEPPQHPVRERAATLAAEVGLQDWTFDTPIAELSRADTFRVRFARALALEPFILLLEHPTAEVEPRDVSDIAARCRLVATARNIASVGLTMDPEFAKATASRVLRWQAASGQFTADGWFSRFRRA